MKTQKTFLILAMGAVGTLVFPACGPNTAKQGEDFISDDPGTDGSGGDTAAGEDGGTLSTGTGNGTEGGDSGADGGDSGGDGDGGDGDAVDLLEADIIQMEGDTLYALSRYSGLSVVEMSQPDELKVLGTWDTDAEAFEMYVDGGQAFVMFNDFWFWEWDDALSDWSYNSSSRLVALDATDPTSIELRGEFSIPGRIQDSRRVGDILYIVTLQDGYCWNCDINQNTRVTSLDVSDPANPQIIDALIFEAPDQSWDWQRSVESTTERMYVAARTWGGEGQGSFIDVIDISSGDGSLTAGAQVQVDGEVFSRWQMDEYEGVLRVISQYSAWDTEPKIETFTIQDSNTFEPLGSADITLPMPESLRSVRFDGDRAYAITAEQTDPLFTIDLSDPAAPEQKGELEIPGWVYHMETRGDRVLALGFDQANPQGSINVSLFDVSVFDTPSLIRRVHFGGDWASFAEDQNRIHKAFSILDDEGMLLVPFSGWNYDEGENGSGEYCWGQYQSGVQIIDWMDDDLTLRGLAPSRGQARRAFTHRDRIVTVSDMQLATFEYGDRDAPVLGDKVALAVQVDNLVQAGDYWVRLARDWYTSDQILEVVSGDDPGSAEPLGTIDLAAVLPDSNCEYAWVQDIYAEGDHVFVLYDVSGEDPANGAYNWYERIRIVSVDISNPAAPVVDDVLELDQRPGWGSNYLANVAVASNWVVKQGDQLVMLVWEYQNNEQGGEASVQVVDLSDPSELKVSASLGRPEGQTQGTLSLFSQQVISWHTEPVDGQPGKVRFYLDRLDLDGTPKWMPKINVPGVVVAYDEQAGRAYTVDFEISELQLTPDECYQHPQHWRFTYDEQNPYDYESPGTCEIIDRTLKRVDLVGNGATLEQSIDIEGELGLAQLEATASRIFAHTRHWEYSYSEDEPYNEGTYNSELVIVDIEGDEAIVHRQDASEFGTWWNLMATDGRRALARSGYGQLSLIDAAQVDAPQIKTTQVPGYGSCYAAVIDDEQVHCPMGARGLVTVDW